MSVGVDVLVIGGGPAGYAAAFRAADIGQTVTIVNDEEKLGGVCLYRGCIPTKALLHAAKILKYASDGAELGISFSEPEIDVDALRAWKDELVADHGTGLSRLVKSRGITYVRGRGRLIDGTHAVVEGGDHDGEEIAFDTCILATGSAAMPLPNSSFEFDRIMNAEAALRLESVPSRLLVVGAGYIGLELSSVYHALGSQVTIAEMLSGLMPGADRDIVKVFEKENSELFEDVMLETKVTAIDAGAEGVSVTFESKDGNSETREFDRVLVTIGRAPRTENLGLDDVGIRTDDKGFVVVDNQRRTSVDSVFAVGDITGPPLLAHKGSHEGIAAAEAAAGWRTTYEPHAIPAVEYTHPEIAWAGVTETEAKERDLDVTVTRFPWSASGRAATMAHAGGLTKLVFERETGQIIGAAIVGENAGELIPEATHAIEMASLAGDLSHTVHPHPTLSETLMEAAQAFDGQATHIFKRKR